MTTLRVLAGSISSSTTPIATAPVDATGDALVLDGQTLVQGLTLVFRRCGQGTLVQDADGGLGAHDGDLGIGPRVDGGGAERAGVHGDVGAAVDLAGHDRHAGNGGFGERVEQLGAAAHDAFPFHAHTGEVAGHVHDHDERDAECVAQPDETSRLLGALRVQAATQAERVVGDDTDGAATETSEAGDDAAGVIALQLLETRLALDVVEKFVNDRADVVGALRRLGMSARRSVSPCAAAA